MLLRFISCLNKGTLCSRKKPGALHWNCWHNILPLLCLRLLHYSFSQPNLVKEKLDCICIGHSPPADLVQIFDKALQILQYLKLLTFCFLEWWDLFLDNLFNSEGAIELYVESIAFGSFFDQVAALSESLDVYIF